MSRPRSDALDASTMDAPRRTSKRRRVATVRVVFRPEAGIVIEPARTLGHGETLAGRTVGAEGIALEDDTLVSREHATFRYSAEQGSLVVEDRKSRNGIQLRGARVERADLQDGDVVRMGSSFMVVRFEDPHQLDVPNAHIVGLSPAMRTLRVMVKRVAASDTSILVTGDSGSGKEVVARAIHDGSGRRGPFIAVNCAAIAETLAESQLFGHVAGAFTGAKTDHVGFFRAAAQGTLFLDEIGDMPAALQPKLLRALETHEVIPVGAVTPQAFAARVVAATNVGLPQAIERGSFRGDLFARLAQIRVPIPALRERREDILALVAHRLPPTSPPLAPDLVEALLTHDWPYNVRELFAVVAELTLWCAGAARLELAAVQSRLGPIAANVDAEDVGASVAKEREELEASLAAAPTSPELEALLTKHMGNVAAVARETGRSRTQVYRWITQLGLDPTKHRGPP